MKMEQTECSEVSVCKIQTLGNYLEESIQCFSCLKLLMGHIIDGQYDIQSLPICVECGEQAKTGSGKMSIILNDCFLFFFFLSFIDFSLSIFLMFYLVFNGQEIFVISKMPILAAGSTPSFRFLGTGEFIFGSEAAGHLCLVLRIRISRAALLLNPYAFMACMGTNLPFTVRGAHFSCSCFPFYSEISICWILGKGGFFFFFKH